jgi:hypothetical protein
MLKASLGFMFSHGLRTRSMPGHHNAIIEFARQRIDRKHAALLTVFGESEIWLCMTTPDSFPTRTRSKLSKPHATIWRSSAPTSPRGDQEQDDFNKSLIKTCCRALR